jgi:hypothetical protein
MREEPLARERATLRRSADRGDIEDHWPEYAARFLTAQHLTRGPRAPTPPDRCVGAGEEISHESPARCVLPMEWAGPQQSRCLRPER